jgi:hypothetical protein
LSHSFEIGCTVQGISAAEEECNQVTSDVSAGDIEATGEVVENDGFVDRNNVGHSVARIDDNS